ncbi:hypothetical protein BDV98DRAFT_631548 [Pterulicium gracile]|uniref:Uncharacterized protein n=1 Tax=Pterulicium gracile TaxID=1884261 RepID=A0A5C3QBR6_9AGAR|nr:hypothetical protein BDV98DRAFT_631548 [Pterula gracilis]
MYASIYSTCRYDALRAYGGPSGRDGKQGKSRVEVPGVFAKVNRTIAIMFDYGSVIITGPAGPPPDNTVTHCLRCASKATAIFFFGRRPIEPQTTGEPAVKQDVRSLRGGALHQQAPGLALVPDKFGLDMIALSSSILHIHMYRQAPSDVGASEFSIAARTDISKASYSA